MPEPQIAKSSVGKEVRIDADVLERYVDRIFVRAGMTEGYAAAHAAALVWANLHGIDSHGVLRVPWYVGLIEQGELNPKAQFEVVRATAATVLIDANRGPGPAVTLFAMDEVGKRAREAGACWGVIRNLSHQGALAYYTRKLAETGLIALATVSSPPNMAPFGARAAGLHNSPISIAVPAERRGALVLDMATSVAAGGKIYLAADRGEPIPQGWALDAAGEDTTDPAQAKIWLPLGPKGSGLALMFECWSSLLAANALALPFLQAGPQQPRRFRQNGIVVAVDVAAFCDLGSYRREADAFADGITSLPPAGDRPVALPGDLEERTAAERRRNGIPLPADTLERLQATASQLGVEALV
jgi:ureidoglycolate dehydrogenase (NAD+)